MIRIKGQVNGLTETNSALAQIPSLLRQAGMSAMNESLVHVSESVRSFLVGPYPTEIERRTGSFRATFARGNPLNIWTVKAEGSSIIGTFGSQDKRAAILNSGGVIRPTRSQFLAVRTEFTKTGRGVVRAKYQQPLRNIPNTFVRMRGPDRGTVFEKIGKRIIPIAWLVRSVFIKGRKFMERGEQKATPGVQTIFQQTFETVITRLNDTLQKIRGGV